VLGPHRKEDGLNKQTEKELEQYREHLEDMVKERSADLEKLNIALQEKIEEHRQAEDALRKSEKNYRLLFENMFDVVYAIDREFKVITVSPSVEAALGYKPEELIGRPFADLNILSPAFLEKAFSDTNSVLSGETIDSSVYEFIARDGTRRFAEINGRPLIRDNEVVGVISVARDITDKKYAQEQVLRQRDVLQGINRVLQEALTRDNEEEIARTCLSVAEELTGSKFGFILEKNPNGRADCIAISDPGWDACKIPGWEAAKLIKNMEIRGIDRSVIREEKSRIINDPASHPDRVGLPKGHPPITAFLGVPLKHGNKTIGMIGLANKESGYDLADQQAIEDLSTAFVEALIRKRVEVSLIKEKERFRIFADFTYDWESWIGPNGKYIYVTPSFERITGYAPDELLKDHKFLETIAHPEDLDKISIHNSIDHARPDEVLSLDFRIITRSGDTRWVSHLCQPVHDADGNWLGRRASNRDITEHKKVEEQLRQAQKMEAVGRLAGGVAHDFNNQLTVVLGFADLILDDIPAESPIKKDLNEIINAGNRASALTRQLLAFSRKQILQPKIVNLNDLINGLTGMFARLIGEDIKIETVLKTGLRQVTIDPGQMEQVIMNLAINARDAMPNGGKLTIETADLFLDEAYAREHGVDLALGPYVLLAVSDNGTGMDEETRSNIFEPFFTTKEVSKGTGLGLSTVYGIIKQSGGYIWVYSEPDHGTTFKIYLPGVKRPAESERKNLTPLKDLNGEETILLAEDDTSLRNLAKIALDRQGYIVLDASTGEDALNLAQTHEEPIHLMITDVIMPRMNGRELADRLHAIRPEMEVLFMSGYTDNAFVHHGVMEAGINFIKKPFTPHSLILKVREILDRTKIGG